MVVFSPWLTKCLQTRANNAVRLMFVAPFDLFCDVLWPCQLELRANQPCDFNWRRW